MLFSNRQTQSSREFWIALRKTLTGIKEFNLMARVFGILGAIGVFSSVAVSQTNTFPSSGNVGIGTIGPGAKLSFNNLNDNSNGADGITWYNPSPLDYGIFRTAGAWSAPDYQQLKLSFSTGIVLDPGSYSGKSYVDIQGNGLRLSSGNLGINTTSPSARLNIHQSSGSWNEGIRLNMSGKSWDFVVDTNGDRLLISKNQNETSGLVIQNGNVGIGNSQPVAPLHISGAVGELNLLVANTSANGARTFLSAFPGKSSIQTDRDFTISTNGGGWSDKFILTNNGNVGIGTTNPGSYKLAVEGKIGAREVNVTTTAWSDYVFNSDYKLRPLSEVQQFIEKNHHLPEVPSEKEVLANGQDLGEMNAILLKKIEELTLYVIRLNEKLDTANSKIRELEGLEKK